MTRQMGPNKSDWPAGRRQSPSGRASPAAGSRWCLWPPWRLPPLPWRRTAGSHGDTAVWRQTPGRWWAPRRRGPTGRTAGWRSTHRPTCQQALCWLTLSSAFQAMDSNTGQVSLSNWVHFLPEATNSAAAINYVSCVSSVGGTAAQIRDLGSLQNFLLPNVLKLWSHPTWMWLNDWIGIKWIEWKGSIQFLCSSNQIHITVCCRINTLPLIFLLLQTFHQFICQVAEHPAIIYRWSQTSKLGMMSHPVTGTQLEADPQMAKNI